MLHLTPQEKRVLWFGLIVILTGCIIRFIAIAWPVPQHISYPEDPLPKLISINHADYKELDSLPGIGKTLAGHILDYRREKGVFTSLEQIRKVKGVTDKVYRQIYFRLKL